MDWSLIILDFYFFFMAEKHLPAAAFIATDLEMRDYRVAGWVKTLRAAETRSVSCRELHYKKKKKAWGTGVLSYFPNTQSSGLSLI